MSKFQFSLRKIKGVTLHYIFSMRRNPARLIEVFIWPVFEVALFIFMSRWIGKANSITAENTGRLIALGVIYWMITARIIQETVAQFIDDIFSRNVQGFLISPLSKWELVAGLILSASIKLFLSFGVLITLLLSLKQFETILFVLSGVMQFLILSFFGITLAILALSAVIILGEKASFAGWIISTVIQLFSCVYYSREQLPFFMQQISHLVPSSYVFENIRNNVSGGASKENFGWMVVALCLIWFAASVTLFRLSYRFARKEGVFAKT